MLQFYCLPMEEIKTDSPKNAILPTKGNKTMDNYFEIDYQIRHFELNKFREASPEVMLALLEEAAAEHCHAINYGLDTLYEQNIGWVLVSGVLKVERYPRYKEKVVIRTWLSEYSTVKGIRENIIYDSAGNIIARAKGYWVFFDIKRRRPAPIFEEIKNQWAFCKESSIDFNLNKKTEPISSAHIEKDICINMSDIDMYGHANNVVYLKWLMDSLPDEIKENFQLEELNGRFVSEIKYGDSVVMLTQKNPADNSFSHTLKIKNTDRVCAIATTKWEKRIVDSNR